MKRRRDRSVPDLLVYINIAAVSALSGIAAFFLSLLIAAAFLVMADFPEAVFSAVSAVLPAAGSFISGITAGYLVRRRGIISGAFFSVPVFVSAFLLSLYTGCEVSVSRTVLLFAVSLFSGAFGGVRGVNTHLHGRPGMKI